MLECAITLSLCVVGGNGWQYACESYIIAHAPPPGSFWKFDSWNFLCQSGKKFFMLIGMFLNNNTRTPHTPGVLYTHHIHTQPPKQAIVNARAGIQRPMWLHHRRHWHHQQLKKQLLPALFTYFKYFNAIIIFLFSPLFFFRKEFFQLPYLIRSFFLKLKTHYKEQLTGGRPKDQKYDKNFNNHPHFLLFLVRICTLFRVCPKKF